jgi:hypothetical protein
MLVRQQRLHLRMIEQPRHELLKHLAGLQAFAVLGERRWIPHQIVRRQADEPAKQQVVVQLLHQLPLRADAIQHLDQQGAQQLLRWHRRSPLSRVEPGKAPAQLGQYIAHQPAYLAQRMPGRNTQLRRYIRKQPTLIPEHTAHHVHLIV